ncbi:MAG: M56 family metallopeptidase, partial [Gemmatimonadaceae bacterium]
MIPFTIELLAKTSLILALGLCVAAALRGATASLRHLVLLATLGGALVLPVAMTLSPNWDVALFPAATTTALANATDPNAALSKNPGSPGVVGESRTPSARNQRDASVPLVVGVQSPSTGTAGMARTNAGNASTSRWSVTTLLISLWSLGFLGIAAWLVTGRVRLARIARTSWPLTDPDWTNVLDRARAEAAVRKDVLLCSSPAVSTPLTWGVRAPVILLPEDAVDWKDDHRHIVLRHELAHVARSDSLTQLLAGIVCALYWFHPFAWIAERRLRAECERACDDRVVSLGTPGPEYASHLLEVARSARAFGAAGFLSVAMARPSQLEGRLLAVLNESRRRASIS